MNKRIPALILSGILCNIPIYSFATNFEDTYVNLKEKPLQISQNINGMDFDMTVSYNEKTNQIINEIIVNDGEEVHKYEYNPNTEIMYYNGEEIKITQETIIDDTQYPKNSRASIVEGSTTGPWSPVSISTTKYHFTQMIGSIAGVAGVICTAVLGLSLVGCAISKSTVVNIITGACTASGLPLQFAQDKLKGYIQVSLYRTRDKVSVKGYSGKRYAYRYQNVRAVYSIKGKNINKQLKSIGKWWV